VTRALRRFLVAFFAIAVFYMIGGSDAIRWARARWRASLQPPSADDMRPPADPAVPLRATLPPEAVRGRMWLSDPPRPISIAVVLGSILLGAVIAMYVTGRPSGTGRES
jgi:hypothetical protein